MFGMIFTSCSSNSTSDAGDTSVVPDGSEAVSYSETNEKEDIVSGETKTMPEGRIEEMISKMTLEQKICQMLMPAFRYETYISDYNYVPVTSLSDNIKGFISDCGFGGVILFTENFEGNDNAKQQAYDLVAAIKKANEDGGNIPMFIACDQEGGYIRRLPFGTYTPGNMALAAAGTSSDAISSASLIGTELNALGINLDFAPVADINDNPSNPIIGVRSFSDDPELASEMVGYFIEGLHRCGIATCLKHFPGHGNTDMDSHTGLPMVNKTLEEILSSELIPFKAGIDSGTDMIMTAHIQFPMIETGTYISKDGTEIYIPATLSKTILTDILRGKLGYDGVISTDALNMDAIKEHYRRDDVAEMAINAGADILLIPVDFRMNMSEYIPELREYIFMVEELVDSGRISEERIDESVTRILKLKEKMGLLDPESSIGFSLSDIGSFDHHERELEIAEHAVTLIKNDGVLPIGKEENVLCFVPYESQETALEYAKAMLLAKGLIRDSGQLEIADYDDLYLEEVKYTYSEYKDNVEKIIVMSSLYSERGLNDSDSEKIDWLIGAAREDGKKVLMISSMLPYDLSRFDDADALMACYLASGMEQRPDYANEEVLGYGPNIIASLLVAYGDAAPQGKLPVDIPEMVMENGSYTYGSGIAYRRGTGISF